MDRKIEIVPQYITLENIPSQSFSIVLDDHSCNIRFSCYNGFTYNWLIVDDIEVQSGVICHCNLKINQYKPKLFNGSLMFINESDDASEPYFDGFNTKYKLIFLTEEQTRILEECE